MFERAIFAADDREEILRYCLRVVISLIDSVQLRNEFLQVLVTILKSSISHMDAINVCQCLVLINDPQVSILYVTMTRHHLKLVILVHSVALLS